MDTKQYITEQCFPGIPVLNEATNKTLIDLKKKSIPFQCCLKFKKIPNSPGAMTARSSSPNYTQK